MHPSILLSIYPFIHPFISSSGAMLGTGLGIGTAALIGDSYVHTFAAFSTFTALSLGNSEGKEREGKGREGSPHTNGDIELELEVVGWDAFV